jgi:hypothetical protein
MTAWIIAGVLLAVVLPLLLARRQRLRYRFVCERSPEHEAQVTALTEWLGVRKIRRVIQHRTGDSAEELDGIHDTVGKMNAEGVRVVLDRFLAHSDVRRVISGYHRKIHGGPRPEIMEALALWAGKRREAA